MSISTRPLPFEADTTEAWRARVERELKGKSYEDHLIWKSSEGFMIEAWQDGLPDPTPKLPSLKEPWKIVEPIYKNDAQKANQQALEGLMNGAEAVWFYKSFLGAAAEVASKGVDRSIAPVFIQGGNCVDPFRNMLKNGSNAEIGTEGTVLIDGKRLRERGAGVVEEIAMMLAQALEVGKKAGFDAPILFHSGMGNAFLTEIAKLRALRWLWCSILSKEGKTVLNPMILGSNLCITYARNDEHTNILRATSSAMSAVLGGTQYVMIEPWDRQWKEENPFSRRISRNIQTLLKEEGRLDKNLNQADGSYLIEHLTVNLGELAWKQVQDIESKGGFTAYAKSGELKRLLQERAEELKTTYAAGDRTLLGVNKYPPSDKQTEKAIEGSTYELLPDTISLPFHIQSQST